MSEASKGMVRAWVGGCSVNENFSRHFAQRPTHQPSSSPPQLFRLRKFLQKPEACVLFCECFCVISPNFPAGANLHKDGQWVHRLSWPISCFSKYCCFPRKEICRHNFHVLIYYISKTQESYFRMRKWVSHFVQCS